MISPILATFGFIIIVTTSTQYLYYMKTAKPMDALTFLWQTGKYIFAFFSLLSFYLLILQYKSLKNKWLKVYLILLAISQLYILSILVWHHWYC
jgi:hypothetical protein